jgi:hypothetical protein
MCNPHIRSLFSLAVPPEVQVGNESTSLIANSLPNSNPFSHLI